MSAAIICFGMCSSSDKASEDKKDNNNKANPESTSSENNSSNSDPKPSQNRPEKKPLSEEELKRLPSVKTFVKMEVDYAKNVMDAQDKDKAFKTFVAKYKDVLDKLKEDIDPQKVKHLKDPKILKKVMELEKYNLYDKAWKKMISSMKGTLKGNMERRNKYTEKFKEEWNKSE